MMRFNADRSSVSHSHMTTGRHPSPLRDSATRLSRSTFAANLRFQNSVRLFGT